MHLDHLLTDSAVLAELGRRLARHRLERNWTQAQLASRAGVGQATVQRAERGESVQMSSMVKLLRTLELLAGVDAAIPESVDFPIAQLERAQHRDRRRARARGGRGGSIAGPPVSSPAVSGPPVEAPAAAASPAAGPPAAAERSWKWGDEPEEVGGARPGGAG